MAILWHDEVQRMWLCREWPALAEDTGPQVVEYGAVLRFPTGEHVVLAILGMELQEEQAEEEDPPEVVDVLSSDEEVECMTSLLHL